MAGYLGASPVPQTIQKKETFTATAGQSTFNTTGYTDGNFINVFLNGVRLVNGTDYTATNNSDIVLASAASASDVLDFETFNEFQLTDQEFANSVIIENNTSEDSDGGRAGKLVYKGKQSGGEQSTLAEIQASHDGSSDDEKADLIFKTNDGSDGASPTERLRIDSAGVTSVSGSFTLDNSGQSQSLVSVGGGSTNAALTLRGSTGSAYAWQISSNAHVASALEFTRSSAVGNTTFSSPKLILDNDGLKFNGDTAADNALNDYEQGSWDSAITCGTSGTITVAGAYNNLAYTKVGRVVTVQGRIIVGSVSSPSGDIRLSLPFVNHGSLTEQSDYAALTAHMYGVDIPSGTIDTFWEVSPGSQNALLLAEKDNAVWQNIDAGGVSANDILYIAGSYITSS